MVIIGPMATFLYYLCHFSCGQGCTSVENRSDVNQLGLATSQALEFRRQWRDRPFVAPPARMRLRTEMVIAAEQALPLVSEAYRICCTMRRQTTTTSSADAPRWTARMLAMLKAIQTFI